MKIKWWSHLLVNACCCCCCQVASVVSDSGWPQRWQPTRLRRPWDSLGKNTAVGCHFLLQCKKVKSESEGARSCWTLSDPMDCSLPGSSIHGIFQARVLEWVAMAFMLGHFSHVWLFVTLWTVTRQTSLSMEYSRQEYWSELPRSLLEDYLQGSNHVCYISCTGRQEI